MDFGLLGLGGFAGSDASTTAVGTTGFASLASSDPETKQKLYGSGILKQERPAAIDDIWRSSKLSKTESMLQFQQRNSPLKYNTTGLFNDGQHMLSFSSCPKSEAFKVEKGSANATLPYGFHLTSSAYSSRNNTAGISFNGASMHGVLTDARGPFTPSQWMELEHQALIYKYITANVPVPTHLLIPIRKAVDSAGFSIFPSGGLLRPNTLGWGTFHLGFSSSADPEPGRCRRTDGKKWRCSRDAVPDQKYCDRHINRGRHRSRKPVEGQSGHSAAKTATNTKAKASVPAASSSSTSASVVGSRGGSGTSTCLAIAQNQHQQQQQQQQLKNLHSAASSDLSRNFLNKENAGNNLFQESSQTDFGLVTPDSLLNPSQKSLSLTGCRSFDGSSHDLTAKETVSQHSIRQFMDDWPKNQSNRSAVSWPELDVQSARTQLSISIPMAPSDFMSSTSSPNREKSTLSPLRLSREHDPVPMGLGVGSVVAEQSQRQANWIPISWETSMGGPLGEVLKKTNSSASECKNASALNLMTEGWDCSPRLGSSPTGVLQKTTFYSVSNSSAGSSPRAENKTSTTEGASLCNDLFGSTLLQSSSSFPSL